MVEDQEAGVTVGMAHEGCLHAVNEEILLAVLAVEETASRWKPWLWSQVSRI